MKIVAGMGSVDDYERLVKAGADEIFCGYVPYEWNKKYGNLFPLNRREVLYYNVHRGSMEEMKILRKMIEEYKVPVTITFNYLYYLDEQYEAIGNIIKELISLGFNDFIIADIGLLIYLKENNIKCAIHLSGEAAEINRLSIEFYNEFNISRYIFHRKNTLKDMEDCISNNSCRNIEYEAFMLNERCHYTGGFCSSLHSDELVHLCKVPYNMAKINKDSNNFTEVDKRFEEDYEEEDYEDEDGYMLGSTGCGICSLKKLREIGVTHLKVVGRGNFIDIVERDIKNLKKAINMMGNIYIDTNYEDEVKKEFFNNKCSKECYY